MKVTLLLLLVLIVVGDNTIAETYYHQDFSQGGIPSHHLIGITQIGEKSEPRRAMELRSRLEPGSDQPAQGNWSAPIEVPAGKTIEIDYRFCPVSGDARYALQVDDTSGRKLITLVWDGTQLLASGGKTEPWTAAAPLGTGEWAHIRYILDPENAKWDLFVNDMEHPALSDLKFRTDGSGTPGKIWAHGSQRRDSVSRFAEIEVRDASFSQGFRTLLKEDFKNFQTTSTLQQVVESGMTEFSNALKVSTVKSNDIVTQGTWSQPLPFARNATEMEIDYWFKPISEASRYALLVSSANDRPIITVIQEKGRFRVMDGTIWKDAGSVKMNEWNRFRYRLNLRENTFDLFVNDLTDPAVPGAAFRDQSADAPSRIWTLGNQYEKSSSLFGQIIVTAKASDEFPPITASKAPLHLYAAPEIVGFSAQESFKKRPAYKLLPANDTSEGASYVKFLRDNKNLYAFFGLDAPELSGRPVGTIEHDDRIEKGDFFQLSLQPDRSSGVYFHWIGNADGTLYDTCGTDSKWDSGAALTVAKRADGWSAMLTIPFAKLGGPPASDAVWGFHAGRENLATNEILSQVTSASFHQPGSFGQLCFPKLNDPRSERDRTAALLENSYNITGLRKELQNARKQLGQTVPDYLEKRRAGLELAVHDAAEQLAGSESFAEYARIIPLSRQKLDATAAFLQEVKRFNALFAPGSPAAQRGYAVFVELPMVKVKPGYVGSGEREVSLRLSGDEYGSFQLVLLAAPEQTFGDVDVTLSQVIGHDGKAVAGAKLSSYLVEPVMTAMQGKIPQAWPDILRPGEKFATSGNMVTLWFDVYLPPGTPTGQYTADIMVTPAGMKPSSISLQVEATGLSLPKSASLDTAFCFSDVWVKEFYGKKTPPEKRRGFYRFLLDHRLEPMDLWNTGIDVGLEYLDYCAEQGKAMLFLPVTEKIRDNEAKYRELIEHYKGRLRPIFFGYDETLLVGTPDKIEAMKRDYAIAKELFPEVPRLNTTAIDARVYGLVDIWCPLFDHLDQALARERQIKGEKVWWYPTDFPLAPYANFNLDSPGIDPRIIPWMTWKLGLSGVLYWSVNREWPTNSSQEAQVATLSDFQSRSVEWMTPEIQSKMARGEIRWPDVPWLPFFRSALDAAHTSPTNGGGNLIYPAPGWEPWASTRLKNLRDGMQDYEYFTMLKNNTDHLKESGTQPELVAKAEAILRIDDDVVGGATDYTKEPAKLLAFRNRLIDLVLETGSALREKEGE